MPLPDSGPREAMHHRAIDMQGYRRADGLFEIEGRISDRKSAPFTVFAADQAIAPGAALHDMWVRLVIDENMLVHEALAVSDATPYAVCPQAAAPVALLIGASVAAGWRAEVHKRIGRASGCTHIVELLVSMGAAAFQTLVETRRKFGEPRDAAGVSRRIDSCHAFARDGALVARVWPAVAVTAAVKAALKPAQGAVNPVPVVAARSSSNLPSTPPSLRR